MTNARKAPSRARATCIPASHPLSARADSTARVTNHADDGPKAKLTLHLPSLHGLNLRPGITVLGDIHPFRLFVKFFQVPRRYPWRPGRQCGAVPAMAPGATMACQRSRTPQSPQTPETWANCLGSSDEETPCDDSGLLAGSLERVRWD